jgi:group I intron endonuclease
VLSLPYADQISGIYKIVNLAKGDCYVGQSQNVKKRVSEHFRLLRNGRHVNAKLQNAFNKYGESNFQWSLEVVCEDPKDLDVLEDAFISGKASFVEKTFYNIADFAKAPMRGKRHTDETKIKIRAGRRAASFNYQSDNYRNKLAEITKKRLFSDPKFVAKVKYIIENDSMTYAERGRAIGLDTSSTRKLYLKYNHLKGVL